jgi:hypothetical protein
MYNGRYEPDDMQQSRALFASLEIRTLLCGSDAHFPWEVGVFRTILPSLPRNSQMLLALSIEGTLKIRQRSNIALSAGISLGAMTKAFKTQQYRKAAGLLASLPRKAFRKMLREIR